MSQSCFSLGFLSQNFLWKLSTFHGYKGYIYWWVFGMWRDRFSKIELVGGLASRLDWVVSSSREQTERPIWNFCPVVRQLARRFIFWQLSSHEPPARSSREFSSTRFSRVQHLVACQSRDTSEVQSRVSVLQHSLEQFFTLSHSLPLHDSHLNTGFLNAEIQANWHGIKPTKWLINFNLTISPFGYSVTKPYNKL